ncbi:MAG: DoxX family membrane protein [Oligoflexales bacterium]
MNKNLERAIHKILEKNLSRLLRLSLGVIFIWFGAVKFIPGASSAEWIATHTIEALTLGYVGPNVSLPALAFFETMLGFLFLSGKCVRLTTCLFLGHMLGTFTPLVLFPQLTFSKFPVAATLEGQYIMKNIVLVVAGLAIWTLSYKEAEQAI